MMVAFPAWLSKAGSPDAFVKDQTSYNAAVQAGYVYPTGSSGTLVTPSTQITSITTIVEIAQNGEQFDGRSSNISKKG